MAGGGITSEAYKNQYSLLETVASESLEWDAKNKNVIYKNSIGKGEVKDIYQHFSNIEYILEPHNPLSFKKYILTTALKLKINNAQLLHKNFRI